MAAEATAAPGNALASGAAAAPSNVAASNILGAGTPSSIEDHLLEVHVLGLPMQDPAILKGTQMVSALIWVEVFLFCEYIITSIAAGVIYVPVVVIFVALPLCGYFGILYSSSKLLRCFACLALVQAMLWSVVTVLVIGLMVFTPPADDSLHQDAEHVVLLVFLSASYSTMTYWGYWLAEKVKGGVVLPSKRKQNQSDYFMLGMQMMDMQILQEVQNLFNASWLVFFFMIYLAVALFDSAVYSILMGEFIFFFLYCISFGLMACMVHAAFIGVKKNDMKLLMRSSYIGSAFCFLFTLFASVFIVMCGGPCFHEWFLLFYIAFAFGWSALHARKLRGRVEAGAQLTRNVTSPVSVTVGTAMAQEAGAIGEAPSQEQFRRTTALQQDGVVMGRPLTEAAAPVASEAKPPAV
jgi:hypothetical protein